ncbi:MAG TPA: IPT/TIG domain-containing protein [Kofleriaceae bacterium]|nr:IPT/TIG domain-containing protein [Kofleriaceae bacterium]
MRGAALVLLGITVAACGDGGGALRIDHATPDHGLLVGGTRVVLTGAGFAADGAGPSRVLIAGREAPLALATDDATLEVVIPPGAQPGPAEVLVTNRHGSVAALGVFRYSAPPTITSVSPADVLFSSTSTVVTVTGTGFADEDAGEVRVLVGGQPASEVQVADDTLLTFVAPPGPALARVELQVLDERGTATRPRAFRYVPGLRPGLVAFPAWTGMSALYFDPVDGSVVPFPWAFTGIRLTSLVRDRRGDYWGSDRQGLFGRLDASVPGLERPIQVPGWFSTMVLAEDVYLAIERTSRLLGRFDPQTGAFEPLGSTPIACCGSYGLAYDGKTLYLTSRGAGGVVIQTVDRATGELGPAVPLVATPAVHIEEMRFFRGTLYAWSRDGRFLSIDPTTGATTAIPAPIGRYPAMEVFE